MGTSLADIFGTPPDQRPKESLADIFDQPDNLPAGRLGASMRAARQFSPEQMAEAQTLSRRIGLSPSVIARNMEEVKAVAGDREFDPGAFIREYPKAAEWLSYAENAALAQDDTQNLGEAERLLGRGTVLDRFLTGFGQIGQAPSRQQDFTQEPESVTAGILQRKVDRGTAILARGNLGVKVMLGDESPATRRDADALTAMLAEEIPEAQGFGRFLAGSAEILPSMVPGVALGLAGGILGGGAAMAVGAGAAATAGTAAAGTFAGRYLSSFALEGGNAMLDFEDLTDENGQKVSPAIARSAALGVGILAGGLDALSLGVVLKPFGEAGQLMLRGGLGRAMQQMTYRQALVNGVTAWGKAYGSELVTETAQQGAQLLGEQSLREWSNMLDDTAFESIPGGRVTAELTETLVEVAIGMVLIAGAGGAVRTATDMQRIVLAEADADAFGEAIGVAEASKLRARDPEKFREAIASMIPAEREKVGVDAERVMILLQEQNIPVATFARAAGVSARELQDAAKAGQDIQIPTANLLANFVGSQGFDQMFVALQPDLKMRPDGMSQREAAEVAKNLEADRKAVQEAMDDIVKNGTQDASGQRVIDDLVAQVTQATATQPKGKEFTPENILATARGLAAFYITRAERLGRDAFEYYTERNYRIVPRETAEPAFDLVQRINDEALTDEQRGEARTQLQALLGTATADAITQGAPLTRREVDQYYAAEAWRLKEHFPEQTDAQIAEEMVASAAQVTRWLSQPKPELTPEQERSTMLRIAFMMQAAFHGTPHIFDRFDLSKIGTGEGAQAYGWGLYFAENQGVAEGYRKSLTETPTYAGRVPMPQPPGDVGPGNRVGSPESFAEYVFVDKRGDLAKAKSVVEGRIAISSPAKAALYRESLEILESLDANKISSEGALYRVDIPDEAVARMLDWDKPLSEQAPEVLALLGDMAKRAEYRVGETPLNTFVGDDLVGIKLQTALRATNGDINAALDQLKTTGNDGWKARVEAARGLDWSGLQSDMFVPNLKNGDDLYRDLSKKLGGDKEASLALLAAGIPGIKYLDAGSRAPTSGYSNAVQFYGNGDEQVARDTIASRLAEMEARVGPNSPDSKALTMALAAIDAGPDAEQQTRNLVVFDDALVTITHRNGEPVTAQERTDFLAQEAGTGEQVDFLAQSASIRRGEETLEEFGLDPKKSYTNREVASALERRQREKYGTIGREDRSPEAMKRIAEWMVAEVEFEMQNPEGSGIGWYSEKFQAALDELGAEFPELLEGGTLPNGDTLSRQGARDLVTAIVAITSDGADVQDNLKLAVGVYRNFRDTGTFELQRGHQRESSFKGNLADITKMYRDYGADGMREVLLETKTIKELKVIAKARGMKFESDYQVTMRMPMSAVTFGEKLGAFYANLMGQANYLTMDRWWSRLFNRYRGTLLTLPTEAGLARFQSLLTEDAKALAKSTKTPAPVIDEEQIISAVIKYQQEYEARGFKTELAILVGKPQPSGKAETEKWMADAKVKAGKKFESLHQLHELERAANTLHKAMFESLEDAPFSAKDRTFMIDTVQEARTLLGERGFDVTPADLQAILWYYEKKLYGQLTRKKGKGTQGVSYADAARVALDATRAGGQADAGVSAEVADGPDTADGVAGDAAVFGNEAEAVAAGEQPFNVDILEQSALPDTIDIDGVQRPTTNANGQPIHSTVEGVKNFWRWATEDGREPIVDANGLPMVLYHGSPSTDIAEFKDSDEGIFASGSPRLASEYTARRGLILGEQKGAVYPVYMRAASVVEIDAIGKRWDNIPVPGKAWKPKVFGAIPKDATSVPSFVAESRAGGADAVIVRNVIDSVDPDTKKPSDVFAVFRGGDVKSALGNSGEFGPTANILRQAPALPETIDIDGVQRPTRNSTGQPIHPTEEGVRNFWRWFGSSRVVDADGRPLVVYHGTTRVFVSFDASVGNIESDWGRAIYTSTNTADVGANYAGIGPDLDSRIERVVERRFDDALLEMDDPPKWGTPEFKEINRRVREEVAAEMTENLGATMPLYAKLENPAIVGGENETILDYTFDEDAGDESGLLVDFVVSFRDIASRYEGGDGVESFLTEVLERGMDGISVREIQEIAQSNDLSELVDANGDLASSEVLRETLEAIGFDGIIDRAVDVKFGSQRRIGQQMAGMTPDTEHVLAFQGEQVKSALGNSGEFGPTANILRQGGQRPNAFILPGVSQQTIALMNGANLSSLLHEFSHDWLLIMGRDAKAADAPQSIKDDYAAILTYLEATSAADLDVRQQTTIEGKLAATEKQEKFARTYERYLATAQAPSLELVPAFARFRSWMKRVYRKVEAMFLPISPEMRGVFDRMLASDAEIDQMQAKNGAALTAEDAKTLGMTDAQLAGYQKAVLYRDEESRAKLFKAVQAASDRENTTQYRELADTIEREIRAEVEAQPAYRIHRFLREALGPDGKVAVPAVKLNRELFDAQYGPEMWKVMPQGIFSTSGTAAFAKREGAEVVGTDADSLALMFEVRDGQAVVDLLRGLEPIDNVVQRQVRDRMAVEYPDLEPFSQALADEAERVTHLENTDDVLVRELKQLAKSAGIRPPSVQAVKQVARETIGAMLVKDIRPVAFQNAEATAARKSTEALRSGNIAKAEFHKRQQLLNHILYREAVRARDRQGVIERFAKRMMKQSTQERLGRAGLAYQTAMNALLGAYGFIPVGAVGKGNALAEFVKEALEGSLAMPAIPESVLNREGGTDIAGIPMQELDDLYSTMQQVYQIAAQTDKALREGETRTITEMAEEVVASIAERHELSPRTIDYYPLSLTNAKQKLAAVDAWHLPPEFLFVWLDGDTTGAAYNAFLKPFALAEADEFRRGEVAFEAMKQIEAMIDLPPVALDRSTAYRGIRSKMTKRTILALALNMGTRSGVEATLAAEVDGAKQFGTYADIHAMFAETLTAADWRYIEAKWDYANTYWPEIAELERNTNGIVPQKLEAEPFPIRTADGADILVKGGYYPLKYNTGKLGIGGAMRDARVNIGTDETNIMGVGAARAQTQHGWTEERVKASGRPLDMNLNVWNAHIANVIHDLTHRKAVRDVVRLYQRKEMRQALEQSAGQEAYNSLKPWLARIANPNQVFDNSPIEHILAHARAGVTVVNMGLSVGVAMIQPLGYLQAADMIGPKWLAQGIIAAYSPSWKSIAGAAIGSAAYGATLGPMGALGGVVMGGFVGGLGKQTERVMEASVAMRQRRDSFNRDIRDYARMRGGKLKGVDAFYFAFIGMMDNAVMVPTWIGGYRRAMAENGGDHEAAVQFADSAVRRSQGAGSPKDLSRIQGGPELRRMLTIHYSFLSRQYGLFRRSVTNWQEGRWSKTRTLASLTTVVALSQILSELVAGRGPDDDEDWLTWAAMETLRAAFSPVVFVRDIARAIGPDAYAYNLSPVVDAISKTVGAMNTMLESVTEGEDFELSESEAKEFIEAVGYWGKLPTRAVWRAVTAFQKWQDGYDVPAADFIRTPQR